MMRINDESMFVLHCRDYGETSLLVELFARAHGRMGAIAKGARKKRSRQGATLDLFQPSIASWSGKGELVTLTAVEAEGDPVVLTGEALFCGFYINELLLKLLHRFDPHEILFDYYALALKGLEEGDHESTLRIFEKRLLTELGYGPVLDHDVKHHNLINGDSDYIYVLEKGPVRLDNNENDGIRLKGSSLLALENEKLDDALARHEIKKLMRNLIAHQLGDKPMHSRLLLKALRKNSNQSQLSGAGSG